MKNNEKFAFVVLWFGLLLSWFFHIKMDFLIGEFGLELYAKAISNLLKWLLALSFTAVLYPSFSNLLEKVFKPTIIEISDEVVDWKIILNYHPEDYEKSKGENK